MKHQSEVMTGRKLAKISEVESETFDKASKKKAAKPEAVV
jgi:hypothetical protein